MGLKSFSRARAIHVMLVYTGGCNGCDIEIVKTSLQKKLKDQLKISYLWPLRFRVVP